MRFVLAIALCGSLGCAMGTYGAKPRLMKAFEAHAESLRWGGDAGLEGMRSTSRRVTGIRVRRVVFNADKDEATIQIELEGYLMPRMVLRRWYQEEKWKDTVDGWARISSKEIKPQQVASSGVKDAPVR